MITYTLQREIPVDAPYEVLVAGGGPAGTATAVCAARLGAKVLLVEATGCLGGMGTSGLVTAFDPMGDGKRMLVGGFMREVVETMYRRTFLKPGIDPNTWRKNYHPGRCGGHDHGNGFPGLRSMARRSRGNPSRNFKVW